MPKIDIEKFATDVQRAQEELGISRRQAAKEAGVGHAYVDKLINGELKRPMYKSVSSLCSALGLDVADYYPDGVPELQQEEVIEMYEAAKDAVKHVDAVHDEMKEQLNTLKAQEEEEEPEPDYGEDEPEPNPETMTVEDEFKHMKQTLGVVTRALRDVSAERDELRRKFDDADARVASLTAERDAAELKFTRANDEIGELKTALSIKNSSLAEKSSHADDLSCKLRADDKLILYLFEFLTRLKDGDVEI